MDPKIKCLKCGSYIHNTEQCWNWNERRQCYTDKKYKESCDCHSCKSKEICQYCNGWKLCCVCTYDRCMICNEHLRRYNNEIKCCWDHTKSPCQFCKLPIYKNFNTCLNYHRNNPLCKECNMPISRYGYHNHDGTLCKKCGTLLNYGSCIYRCVNGGKLCVHCYSEGVINNMCRICNKEQTGQLTKAAIK